MLNALSERLIFYDVKMGVGDRQYTNRIGIRSPANEKTVTIIKLEMENQIISKH